jgi:hypothetical protein
MTRLVTVAALLAAGYILHGAAACVRLLRDALVRVADLTGDTR